MKAKGKKKTRIGVVTSDKMEKTIVVRVERRTVHTKYKRTIGAAKKFKAHDEKNTAKKGDKVKIQEARPMSKDKRWRLVEIIK